MPALNAIISRDKEIKIPISLRKEQLANRKITWLQSEILIRETSFIYFRLENNHPSVIKTQSYSLQIIGNMKTLAVPHTNFSTYWQDEPCIL